MGNCVRKGRGHLAHVVMIRAVAVRVEGGNGDSGEADRLWPPDGQEVVHQRGTVRTTFLLTFVAEPVPGVVGHHASKEALRLVARILEQWVMTSWPLDEPGHRSFVDHD